VARLPGSERRVLCNGHDLLLLPGEGESTFETIRVRDAAAIPDILAGTHVLLIRS
jgi:hypothetical protein